MKKQLGTLHDSSINLLFSFLCLLACHMWLRWCVCVAITAMKLIIFTKKKWKQNNNHPLGEHKLVVLNVEKTASQPAWQPSKKRRNWTTRELRGSKGIKTFSFARKLFLKSSLEWRRCHHRRRDMRHEIIPPKLALGHTLSETWNFVTF